MASKVTNYLALILRPFWQAWWSVLTGVATLLSYLTIPNSGIQLSPLKVSLLVLAFFTLIFLVLAVITQSWRLYLARQADLQVIAIQKSDDHGGKHVFLLAGTIAADIGTVLEIRRPIGDIEAPFALVELIGINARGFQQSREVWFAPAHLNEFSSGKVSVGTLIVNSFISAERIRASKRDF